MKRFLVDPVRSVVTLAVMTVVTAAVCVTIMAVAVVNPAGPAIERIIQFWSRTWFRVSGTRLEVRGSFDPTQSYVVVSNHSSWLDIMANFLATPVPLRFLAKKELFKIPLLAPAMRAIGIIEIDRTKAATMHERINDQAAQVAGRAQSIMVYPEGTRTRDGEIKRFKVGAFMIAIENNLPILPVTIAGSFDSFPSDSAILHGGTIIAEIGDPIPTEGLTKDDVRQLARSTQDLITQTRAHLDTQLP